MLALDGGPDGLELLRRLLAQLDELLSPGGVALLEIGSDPGRRMSASRSATALPTWEVTVHDDLAGLPRVVELSRPAAS